MAVFSRKDKRRKTKVDRREAWTEAAARVGGALHTGKRPGQDEIVLQSGPRTVVLDTYTVHTGQVTITYTRARTFFVFRADIDFRVRQRTFFHRMLESLGFGAAVRVNRVFDRKFVVRGKPVARLRSMVTPGLAEALLQEPAVSLTVKRAGRKDRKRLGERAAEATALVVGVIKDPDRIVALFTIMSELCEALDRAGVASFDTDPIGP